MKGLRSLLRARVLVAALVLVVGAAVYVASLPQSDAIVIAGPSVCVYYKDASFRTVVGARGTGCCGETIRWGITTKYVRCERLYCLDVLCPN